MIGRLRGVILQKTPPELLLDVNGVGYEVQSPMSTFYVLPEVGQEITIHIHFVVREDAQLLFGFMAESERSLFRTLIKVNGVGPKLALTILSGIEAEQFVYCVQNNDSAALIKLPGVGKKTAERLLVEMRDKFDDWAVVANAQLPAGAEPLQSPHKLSADAESALIALGYKPAEAAKAISAALDDDINSSEELIRRALRGMVKT
ncbi:MAG: Holliday junction branch migration protein RuvA [Sinobacterium sp.]|jgi:Holliday junction DNA helicase RuvA|tara:strand:- start:18 stop:629 length:612 start_codon:yes stop_codon:yes gene_type:complete